MPSFRATLFYLIISYKQGLQSSIYQKTKDVPFHQIDGTYFICIILVIPFLIIGVLFAIFKEKAAKFVSGFNSFSKEEQALYDKARSFRKI